MPSVVQGFGFDSFMYGRLTEPRPQRDSRSLLWTAHPREWLAQYDRNAYIEVDPRVTHTSERVTPFVQRPLSMGPRGDSLSAHEQKCLRMAAHGLTSVEIGAKLGVARRTIDLHFHNIVAKLGVPNRHEAITRGNAIGLVRIEL
jgi:ATP/maltotriose-dependent transcriptional regulator MalT